MEMSSNFMNSIDLQNGVFEEQGMQMLEKWEKESSLLLMGGKTSSSDTLDLNSPISQPQSRLESGSDSNTSYDNLFK